MSLINKIDSYFNCCDFSIYDGLSYSSDSLFISTKNIGNALIVANNNKDAEKIYLELNAFNKLKKESEKIILIPGIEDMPYDMVDSDKYLSSKRNLSLFQYLNSNKTNIKVVTTIKNIQRKLIPQDILLEETIRLKKK